MKEKRPTGIPAGLFSLSLAIGFANSQNLGKNLNFEGYGLQSVHHHRKVYGL